MKFVLKGFLVLTALVIVGAAGWTYAGHPLVAAPSSTDTIKMPVHLLNAAGKEIEIDPHSWYLIPLNGLQQALSADSENQCAQMLEQLPKDKALCKPGTALSSPFAEHK